MKVDVKETGAWKRALHIEIPAEEVHEEMKRVVREFRRKASLPGFRKGRVPDDILERRFSAHLEDELIDRVIPRAYQWALGEAGLDPISKPEIRDFKYLRGQPLTFVAHVEVRPKLEIADPGEIRLTKRIHEVDEGALDRVIEQIRDQNPEYVPVDREGINTDRLKLTLLDRSRGKDARPEEVSLILGSESLMDEFQDALIGCRAGDEREITVTYPEGTEDKELAGRTKRFHLEVLEVGERKLPPIDDAFAKTLGLENLEALRSRVRIRLESEELVRADREVESALIRRLIERRPFEAPDVMVQNLLENLIEDLGVPEEQRPAFRERQRAAAVMAVQRMLLTDEIVRREGLGVSDAEVEAAIHEAVQDESQRERAVHEAKKDGRFERYRRQMEERKALDFLLEKAEIEEVRTERPAAGVEAGAGTQDAGIDG